MMQVLPNWNQENSKHNMIPVFYCTKIEEVKQFVNEKSYGRKVKGLDKTHFSVNFHGWNKREKYFDSPYRWHWEVLFEAGTLEVVGDKKRKYEARKTIKSLQDQPEFRWLPTDMKSRQMAKIYFFITIKIDV